jgi:hypothetical protein
MEALTIIEIMSVISTLVAGFVFGLSIGVIMERKKIAAEYEWDAGVHDRLNKIEEFVNLEYQHIENQFEKFQHELSYTQKFIVDELEGERITLELPDASEN